MISDDERLLDLLIEKESRRRLAEHGLQISVELRVNGHPLDPIDYEVARYLILDEVAEQGERNAHFERLASLGEVSAEIVHDLSNIATTMNGFARIAQKSLDNPNRLRKVLDSLVGETARCARMAAGFLSITRTGERVPMAVNASVESVVELMRHQLRSHGVAIDTQLAPENPTILGSDTDIARIVLNLLHNAQQAIGRDGQVSVVTRIDDDRVEIRVSDDGPGIPDHIRDRIFEPMFTTKAPGKGTGLGLAICARIVAAHKGTMFLDSGERVGNSRGGATFVIQLPIHQEGGL